MSASTSQEPLMHGCRINELGIRRPCKAPTPIANIINRPEELCLYLLHVYTFGPQLALQHRPSGRAITLTRFIFALQCDPSIHLFRAFTCLCQCHRLPSPRRKSLQGVIIINGLPSTPPMLRSLMLFAWQKQQLFVLVQNDQRHIRQAHTCILQKRQL
jgi:hypothetical protein